MIAKRSARTSGRQARPQIEKPSRRLADHPSRRDGRASPTRYLAVRPAAGDLVWLAAGDREAAEDDLRADAEGLRSIHRHHEGRAGAVGQLGGVAGGHGALAGILVEVRRQLQEAFERRVRTIALVLLDVVRLLPDDRALLVEDAARDVHRRQLFLEEAFLLAARGALLAQERVTVLGLAADLVALGDDLGRVAHHHVNAGQVLLHPRIRVAVALAHRD